MLNQLLFPVAKRFVSGHTIQEALAAVRRLNASGILTTLDVLGENVTTAVRPMRPFKLTWKLSTGFNGKA